MNRKPRSSNTVSFSIYFNECKLKEGDSSSSSSMV